MPNKWLNLVYLEPELVVYIEHENDSIRIISARKATRKEREYYEN